MEESEVPLEKISEDLQEESRRAQERWIGWVAMSSALLAVLAAISALLSGHHVNEAMMERVRASDSWGYYQAKSIKASVLSAKKEILGALGKKIPEEDLSKEADYKQEQEDIAREATKNEKAADEHLEIHHILARSVTFFQIAIAVSAIAVLSRRRRFWLLSLAMGGAGLGFLALGLWMRGGI